MLGPLFFSQNFLYDPFSSGRLVCTLLVSSFVIALVKSRNSIVIPDRRFLTLGISLIVLQLLSSLWSLNPELAILGGLESIFLGLLVILLLNLADLKKVIFVFISTSFTVSLVVLLFQIINSTHNFSTHDLFGLFRHKNIFSFFLILTTPLLWICRKKHDRYENILCVLLTVILIPVVIFLNSRNAIFSSGLALVFSCAVIAISRLNGLLTRLFTLATILAALAASLFLCKNRVDLNSLNERLGLWQNSSLLIKDNPIVGVGQNQWPFHYQKYGTDHIESFSRKLQSVQNPHNEILELTCELGITGVLITSLIMFYFIKLVLTNWRKEKSSILYIYACTSGFLISLFSYPLSRPIICIILCFTVALVLKKSEDNISVPFKPLRIFSLLLFTFLIGIFFFRIKSESAVYEMIRRHEKNDFSKTLTLTQEADFIFYQTDFTSKPIKAYKIASPSFRQSNEFSIDFLISCLAQSPYDVELLSNIGVWHLQNSDLNNAEKYLLCAYDINPYYNATLVNIVITYINMKKLDNARLFSRKIDNFEVRYPDLAALLISEKQK